MSAAEDDRPLFLRQLRPRHNPQPVTRATALPGTATAYAAKAFESELDTLARTVQGGRNAQLNTSAFNLAQLVRAGHLDHQGTWDALYDCARKIGLPDHETRATLGSAFRAATPRDVPEQDPVPNATVYTPPDSDEAAASIADRFPAIDWHELWADDTQEEWIVYPILPARRHVALFSPPKVGKSLLLLELAVAIATGQDVLGTKLDRPRRVLYVDFENDPRGDIRTRLVDMEQKPADLGNLLYLSYPPFLPLDGHEGSQELLAVCAEYEVEVVVIDTVSRTVRGEENENDTWIRFYRHTGLALKQAQIACIRLDHTGKDASKGMRGGSAKYGDLDAVWALTKVSDTTFKLECTANRMQIGEKLLVLERKAEPLRHEVRGNIGQALMDAKYAQIIAHIDELYGADVRVGKNCHITFNQVDTDLRAADWGVSREKSLKPALEERDRMRFGVVPLPDLDRYREDD